MTAWSGVCESGYKRTNLGCINKFDNCLVALSHDSILCHEMWLMRSNLFVPHELQSSVDNTICTYIMVIFRWRTVSNANSFDNHGLLDHFSNDIQIWQWILARWWSNAIMSDNIVDIPSFNLHTIHIGLIHTFCQSAHPIDYFGLGKLCLHPFTNIQFKRLLIQLA